MATTWADKYSKLNDDIRRKDVLLKVWSISSKALQEDIERKDALLRKILVELEMSDIFEGFQIDIRKELDHVG